MKQFSYYINTVPRNHQQYSFILIKIQNNFLYYAFTKKNIPCPDFSIAVCVNYLAAVTVAMKSSSSNFTGPPEVQ